MSAASWSDVRRSGLVTAVAASAFAPVLLAASSYAQPALAAETVTDSNQKKLVPGTGEIRPFRVKVPEQALVDLRRRIAATRWPDRETVPDRSQGAQLAKLQELVRYWGSGYDWRKAEAKLNALPQFLTNIDDVDIHFIHVRSRHEDALPVIITHGWPGSVIELLKIIDPLTDPTAFGGRAEDAFDVVIPSLPGYAFSGKPTRIGWTPERIAGAWAQLSERHEGARAAAWHHGRERTWIVEPFLGQGEAHVAVE